MVPHFLADGFIGNIMTVDVQQAAGSARDMWLSLLCAEAAVKEIFVLLCALIRPALDIGRFTMSVIMHREVEGLFR